MNKTEVVNRIFLQKYIFILSLVLVCARNSYADISPIRENSTGAYFKIFDGKKSVDASLREEIDTIGVSADYVFFRVELHGNGKELTTAENADVIWYNITHDVRITVNLKYQSITFLFLTEKSKLAVDALALTDVPEGGFIGRLSKNAKSEIFSRIEIAKKEVFKSGVELGSVEDYDEFGEAVQMLVYTGYRDDVCVLRRTAKDIGFMQRETDETTIILQNSKIGTKKYVFKGHEIKSTNIADEIAKLLENSDSFMDIYFSLNGYTVKYTEKKNLSTFLTTPLRPAGDAEFTKAEQAKKKAEQQFAEFLEILKTLKEVGTKMCITSDNKRIFFFSANRYTANIISVYLNFSGQEVEYRENVAKGLYDYGYETKVNELKRGGAVLRIEGIKADGWWASPYEIKRAQVEETDEYTDFIYRLDADALKTILGWKEFRMFKSDFMEFRTNYFFNIESYAIRRAMLPFLNNSASSDTSKGKRTKKTTATVSVPVTVAPLKENKIDKKDLERTMLKLGTTYTTLTEVLEFGDNYEQFYEAEQFYVGESKDVGTIRIVKGNKSLVFLYYNSVEYGFAFLESEKKSAHFIIDSSTLGNEQLAYGTRFGKIHEH